MRKTMIIPTYWCRKTGDPWQEGDAVYDHPTPVALHFAALQLLNVL